MTLSFLAVALIVLPLILIEGFFSGSEIALLSADRLTLKNLGKRGHRGAALALELAKTPERILSSTLFMTSLSVIGASALIELYFISRGERHPELVAVAMTSPAIVLLGELIPKTVYQRHATTLAPWVARPVVWTYFAFYPFTRILAFYTTRLSRLAGPIEELIGGKRRSTREELRALLSYSRKETEIKPSEKRMIKRIFDFKDTEAKHALIPLVRVEGLDEMATVREALEAFRAHRHSRMPVYSERVDNIVGVVEAMDLLLITDLSEPISRYVQPARYVAETQALDDLMIEMRLEDNEFVVVVDEYGGAVGILTFEDIVEEIVGEINDEDDSEQSSYKALSESKWLIQARMEISEINENLRLELPEGEYETMNGFLLQMFGRIPETGDELYFDTPQGSFKLLVRKANPRAVESIVIERLETPTVPDSSDQT